MRANIEFQDSKSRAAQITVDGVVDFAHIGAMVTTLQGLSKCKINTYGAETEQTGDCPSSYEATTDQGWDSVDRKAVLTFKYTDANNDGHTLKMELPAPVSADFALGRKARRLTKVRGDQIAGALSSLTGLTLKFKSGKVNEKHLQAA
jgi:hypothetical protein